MTASIGLLPLEIDSEAPGYVDTCRRVPIPSTSSSFRLVSLLCVALSLLEEVGTEDGKKAGFPTAVCSKGFCCSNQYLKSDVYSRG